MDWDVVVVGASSAGLFAAAELARAGQRVAVFEQVQTLRPARRTLIVTPHLWRILPTLQAPVLLHKISQLILASPNADTRVPLYEPDLIIERHAFIQSLLQRATAAGVTVFLDRRFRTLCARENGVELEFQNGARQAFTTSAGSVLGADGVFSDVAVAVGLTHPPSVPILQAEIELAPDWNPTVTQVWFDANETRFFYWLIPESSTRAVVGLVGEERAQMRHLLRRFMEREGFQALSYQGARIALYHPRLQVETRVGKARVLLIGDAAGQVKVTTVGGSVSGLLGAAAAARALIHNQSYQWELRAVTRELDLHWYMRAALDRFDNRAYDQLVQIVNPRLREFLSRHNRDELAGVVWHLPLIQPRLMTLAPQLVLQMIRGNAAPPKIARAAQDESLR